MSTPNPASITPSQFRRLLDQYPAVIRAVYGRRIKDSKKLEPALDDDGWRYGELGKVLEGRRAQGKGESAAGGWIEKEELERLVRWKITHGTNRPFLPALIRKNAPDAVKSASTAAFASHAQIPTSKFPTEPLKHLTSLSGVGPATATLVLSIANAENVPFFEDELYAWLCGAGVKLKYNLKEYEQLWGEVRVLRERLGGNVRADEVERVGFVVGHLDVLSEKQKNKILEEREGDDRATGKTKKDEEEDDKTEVCRGPEEEQSAVGKVSTKDEGKMRANAVEEKGTQVPRKESRKRRVRSTEGGEAASTRKSSRLK